MKLSGASWGASMPAGQAAMSEPLTNHVEIAGDPSSGALRIDGHLLPFSAAVLRMEAPHTPVLSVALPVIGGVVVTLEAKTGFEETTRAALMAMGWTPPDMTSDEAMDAYQKVSNEIHEITGD